MKITRANLINKYDNNELTDKELEALDTSIENMYKKCLHNGKTISSQIANPNKSDHKDGNAIDIPAPLSNTTIPKNLLWVALEFSDTITFKDIRWESNECLHFAFSNFNDGVVA